MIFTQRQIIHVAQQNYRHLQHVHNDEFKVKTVQKYQLLWAVRFDLTVAGDFVFACFSNCL